MTLARGPALKTPTCSWQVAVIALTSETPVKVRTQHPDSTRGKLTRVEGYRLQLPSTPHDHRQDPGPRLGKGGNYIQREWTGLSTSQRLKSHKHRLFLTAASRSLMSYVSVAEDTRPWCFLAKMGEAGIMGVPHPCHIQQGWDVTETAGM